MNKKAPQKPSHNPYIFNNMKQVAELVASALTNYLSKTPTTVSPVKQLANNKHHKSQGIDQEKPPAPSKSPNMRQRQQQQQQQQQRVPLAKKEENGRVAGKSTINLQKRDLNLQRESKKVAVGGKVSPQKIVREMVRNVDSKNINQRQSVQEWLQNLNEREQLYQERIFQRRARLLEELNGNQTNTDYNNVFHGEGEILSKKITEPNLNNVYVQPIVSKKPPKLPNKNPKTTSKTPNKDRTPSKKNSNENVESPISVTDLPQLPSQSKNIMNLSNNELMSILRANRDKIFEVVQKIRYE